MARMAHMAHLYDSHGSHGSLARTVSKLQGGGGGGNLPTKSDRVKIKRKCAFYY